MAVIVVALTTVKLEVETPPIFTTVAPVRLVPVMVALAPPTIGPALGLTAVTVGAAGTFGTTGVVAVPPALSAAIPPAMPAAAAPPMSIVGRREL